MMPRRIGPPCSISSRTRPLRRRMSKAAVTGVHVTAKSNETNSAITIVIASARKNTPATPSRKARGMKTTIGVSVLATRAGPTS